MDDLIEAAAIALDQVRRERPLIHLLTNFVTMRDVANAVLAIGARPVMAHAPEEVEEIVRAARALVLNLGTPSRERVETMLRAGQAANEQGIPIVFDPVGVGASSFRRENAARVFEVLRIAIVRGNASEMGVLAGVAGAQSGVDAAGADYDRAAVARSLATQYGTVVVITGPTDFISDGTHVVAVGNGTPLQRQVTGAGDMLTAIIGSSMAVKSDALLAAASGTLWFGIAAERAARQVSPNSLGSYHVALLDALSDLDADAIRHEAQVWAQEDTVQGDAESLSVSPQLPREVA